MSRRHPGRGRPTVMTPAIRRRYLTAVADGNTLTDAADAAGITERTAHRTAQTDPEFAAAREAARTAGRQTRNERIPHGEYRYNVHQCRCPICTQEASRARNNRPDRRAPAAPVLTITPPASAATSAPTNPAFPLAKAS